ncbi:methyl-accepting chemotaxis protein [Paenibacillus thermoaerophilus]|uniref:Methyl-accepting chemotaxis protein n=1 Tax=Paenibacillus thermoaerophilus TaxID=1215385 RepID=A0ABW2V0N0_9BACL|nr:methyl-accepting chemotaxis protein [Paenibacillus thermoaerophilus]TMV09414.1 HAMP domain-containing protein [Paenibacillus thermoaerophilus]
MKFPIRIKLLASFLGISVMLGAAGIIAYVSMGVVDRSYSDLVNRRVLILLQAKEMQVKATQINSSTRDYLLTQDSAAMDKVNEAVGQLANSIQEGASMVQTEANKRLLQDMQANLEQIKQAQSEMVRLMQTSREQALRYATDHLFPLSRDIRTKSDELAAFQQTQMEIASEENTATVENAQRIVMVSLAVSLAAAIGLALYLASRLSKPLVQMTAAAQLIADGDLTRDIPVIRSRDELGSMSAAFQQMASHLRSLIRTVALSAKEVATSSQDLASSAEQSTQAAQQVTKAIQDIAAGADNQAKGAESNSRAVEELAKAIQRLAASTEVMHSTSQQTAERAGRGSQLLQRLSSQMETVHQASNESSEMMDKLYERLSEIGSIVGLMREIASQTQLLSLNASIEAARAGAAGQGFAVVAGEVKKLAAQSEQSAHSVAELLEGISLQSSKVAQAIRSGVQEVENGLKSAFDANQAFVEILESVRHVEREVQEASVVSEQMAASSQEISAAMEETVAISEETSAGAQEVTAATEQQLASLEQISSASAELSRTAQELNEIVSRFRV